VLVRYRDVLWCGAIRELVAYAGRLEDIIEAFGDETRDGAR